MAEKVPAFRQEVAAFRNSFGAKKVGDVTVESLYSGMRMLGLVTETSVLDPEQGIRFRGLSIPEVEQVLPKAEGGEEPLPEALFWLLLTGEVPSRAQVRVLSEELATKADLPSHVVTLLANLPSNLHPMAQLVSAMAAMNSESRFAASYKKGMQKTDYWKETLEDSINLIAKLPVLAATIHNNLWRDHVVPCPPDPDKDWSQNFALMLGYEEPQFAELLRLFLTIHADHEGGNVSAHTVHLVGSALADPYLAVCAGYCGLAGPLHGLASQEVLTFLDKMLEVVGEEPSDAQVEGYIEELLAKGRVVPGCGHAVLRRTDPRFTCQQQFGLKHMPEDLTFKAAGQLYRIAPQVNTDLSHCQRSHDIFFKGSLKDWKGQESLAQCGRPLRTSSPPLWDE